MEHDQPVRPSRRNVLRTIIMTPVAYLLAACGMGSINQQAAAPTLTPQPSAPPASVPPVSAPPVVATATEATAEASLAATVQALAPTPACGDDDDPTPDQTQGPYYKASSPERTSLLEPGVTGAKLVVTGQVLTTDCQPAAQAMLDFWQSDDQGEYDNAGFRLRGHQFADDQGRFTLETIVPNVYPGRTRHLHVRVQAPNQPMLITQLYFPDEPRNEGDDLFDPALLMDMQDAADGKAATFNFVLAKA